MLLDIVYQGRRHVVAAGLLDLGDLSTDRELRQAVAAHLGLEPARLSQHSLVRLPTGRILLRVPLRLRLAPLVQRVILLESRFRVALGQVVEGVLGHPLARRGRGFLTFGLAALTAVARVFALGVQGADRVITHIAVAVAGALEYVAGLLACPLDRMLRMLAWLGPALRLLGLLALLTLRGWSRVCEVSLEVLAVVLRPLTRLAAGVSAGCGRLAGTLARRLRRWLAPWLRAAWGLLVGTLDRVLTGRTAADRERDHRVQVLDSLLTTPHGDLAQTWAVHERLCHEDPLFYAHLAAWYARKGQVRDHQEMFVIALVLSPQTVHREVGLALLRRLPPYEVARVVDFIRGTVARGRHTGLFRSPPRSLRTEVERYLREREANPDHFDGAVLAARSSLKRLYSTLHVRPGARAQAILFEDRPPKDSRLFALKELARRRGDAAAQAEILRRTAIPYKVAVSVLGEWTPELAEALVERMTPQEVINHLGRLPRCPAVERKLEQARTHGRVTAHKAQRAAAVAPEYVDRLRKVTEDQLRRRGRLTLPTAVFVDASASMAQSREIGQQIASMLETVTDAPVLVRAFSDRVHELDDRAASGSTSPGAAVAWLLKTGQLVQQLIFLTDQRENQRPRLAAALRLYRRRVPHVRVVFITLPGGVDTLYRQCLALKLECQDHRFSGDYYSLPDLLPRLSAPTRLGLLMEILETPLPTRS